MNNPYVPQSQRDALYSGVQLGRCNGVSIGGAGCFITVAAMIDSHYKGVLIMPDVINRLALEQGLYVNGCLYPDEMLTKLVQGLQVAVFNYQNGPADLSKLEMTDEEECLVVVDFDHDPRDGIQIHALRAFAWDGKNLIVDDPWFGTRENFTAHYGTNLTQTIQKIVKYRLPGFVPPWKQPASPPIVIPVSRQEFDNALAEIAALKTASETNSEFLQGIKTAWDKVP